MLDKQARIADPKVIAAGRKGYCELCGAPAYNEPHHVKSRGAGGHDIKENLIQLCSKCHILAHTGQISRAELVAVIAKREGITQEEVYDTISLLPGELIELSPGTVSGNENIGLEELFQVFASLEECTDDIRWIKGEVADELTHRNVSIGDIANAGRCSKSQIRQLITTYQTFPSESDRIPELAWYHHRVAAGSQDPAGWLAIAADTQMSTRQLSEAIKEEGKSKEQAGRDQQAKAEKTLRIFKEVIEAGGEPADWLLEEIDKFMGQESAA